MSAAPNPDARGYYLPAVDRLEDADVLLANGRAGGAIYLAGFAVECLFKAVILANSTRRQRPALVTRLKTEFGHDLDGLRKELERRGMNLGPAERAAFRELAVWDNNIRYEARVQSSKTAGAVIAAARKLFGWADRLGGAMKVKPPRTDRDTCRVEQAIRDAYVPHNPGATVAAYRHDGWSIRVRVVNPRFHGLDMVDRQAGFEQILRSLPEPVEERVTMVLTLTPEERAASPLSSEFDRAAAAAAK